MYLENFEKIKENYHKYWNKENHDRPLVDICAPKNTSGSLKPPIAPDNLADRWLDAEYVIKKSRYNFQNTLYFGEGFPALSPNLGPDILGAICGCEIEFGEDTSWAKHYVENWENLADIVFDEDNKWWKSILDLTQEVIKDCKGDYIVGITDLHPGSDALVSLRGPQELCFDVIEQEHLLYKYDLQIFEVYKKVYQRLYNLISAQGNGSTYWMGVWSDQRHYVVGSDFSCMVSPETYETLIAPSIEREIEFLDQSIYHLDGPQALRHLDRILKMENLNGVQWVYGAGQPSAKHWIPILQKIQNAGKCIDLSGPAEDLPDIMKYLNPEGVLYHCWCKDEDEAKQLLSTVENNRTK